MKLYDTTGAPNPRRVRIFMAEKGVECEKVELNIVKGENLSEEFLAVNPRGMMPTMVLDDGTVIDETVAICRYIEEAHPEPALMGTDATHKAQVEMRQRHMEWDGLIPAMESFRNSFPGFSSRGLGGNVGEVAAIPEMVERGQASLIRFYESLDAYLANNEFVEIHFLSPISQRYAPSILLQGRHAYPSLSHVLTSYVGMRRFHLEIALRLKICPKPFRQAIGIMRL